MYSGYYCKKCKIIPLIKAHIFNTDINFTVKCKCNTYHLSYEKLNKDYYSKNIEQKNIINAKIAEDIKNKESLSDKIEDVLKIIRYNKDKFIEVKNMFDDYVNYINSIINKMDDLFKKANKINENIENLALILINSYKNLSTNYSNINNIHYIINNDFKKIDEDKFNTKYLFNEDNFNETMNDIITFIERNLPINQQLEFVSDIKLPNINDFLILSKKLLLLYGKESINFVSMNDMKLITKIETESLIKIIKDKKNNIICLYPRCFKIIPEITYNYIISFKNSLKNKKQNKFFEYLSLGHDPIYVFDIDINYINFLYWNDDNDKVNKDKIILNNEEFINFYKYNLAEKSVVKYHTFNINSFKMELIKYNNNSLLIFTQSNLSLFDLHSLKIIGNFEIGLEELKEYPELTTLQINNDECLVTVNRNIFLLNLKNLRIKLKIKYESKIIKTFLLDDKSIIICGVKICKRYSPNTFGVISNFYICEEVFDYNSDEYDYGNKYTIKNYDSMINCLKLPNSKFLILLDYGKCKLNKLII